MQTQIATVVHASLIAFPYLSSVDQPFCLINDCSLAPKLLSFLRFCSESYLLTKQDIFRQVG